MNKIKLYFQNLKQNEGDRVRLAKLLRAVSLAIFIFIMLYIVVGVISKIYGVGIMQTQSLDANVIIYEKNFDKNGLKGKIVFFLLPKETPYFKQYSNFAKYVRCEGGDRLSVKGLKYFCNNKLIGIAKTTDQKGKKVEQFVFEGTIPEGQYFVMGTHERSFDSRYWGFVNENLIRGVSVWEL